MGAQEVNGKIFNSRTLPKPVIPDSMPSSNHLTSPFTRPLFTTTASPPTRQDNAFELPKVKRESSPDGVETLHRSSQLPLPPMRQNGSSPTLLGLASVCSSRSPLPSLDSDPHSSSSTSVSSTNRSTIKSRPYSPPPSPYPKRRTSTSSGENMDNHYTSPRLGNRDPYDHRDRRNLNVYNPTSRDRSNSNPSSSSLSANGNTNSGVRPMLVDSPSPGLPPPSARGAPVPLSSNGVPQWTGYRSRGGTFPNPPPALSSHNTHPSTLGVPSPYNGHKRPSPSAAGESEKEDMEDDSEGATPGIPGMPKGMNGIGLDGDEFTSHREKRRVIEKKSRMRRVDALDHLRLVVSREFQYQHQRSHSGPGGPTGPLSALHNIDPLTQAPRKNCQADICFEAVEIIEKLRSENDRLRNQNRDLLERLSHSNSHNQHHNHIPHPPSNGNHGHGHAHQPGPPAPPASHGSTNSRAPV